MSLETWIEEWYPINSLDFIKTDRTERELIEHSLRKWRGSLEENTENHEVVYTYHAIHDLKSNKRFSFNSESCVLCEYSQREFGKLDSTKREYNNYCIVCPIVRYNKNPCCSSIFWPGIEDWRISINNPQPMIDLLEKVLELSIKEASDNDSAD